MLLKTTVFFVVDKFHYDLIILGILDADQTEEELRDELEQVYIVSTL